MKKIIILILSIFLFVSCGILEERGNQKVMNELHEEIQTIEEDELSQETSNEWDLEIYIYSDEAKLGKKYIELEDLERYFHDYYEDKIWNIVEVYTHRLNLRDGDNNEMYNNHNIVELEDFVEFDVEVFIKIWDAEGHDIYKLTWEIQDWEITILSDSKYPDRIILKDISLWWYRAYIEQYRWSKAIYVVETQTWKKQIIDEISSDDSFVLGYQSFDYLNILDDTLLIYSKSWWEFSFTNIINLNNNNSVEYSGAISDYRLLSENKYMYICNPGGMHAGIFSIYEYPSLKLVSDIEETFELNDWWNPECISQYIWESEYGSKISQSYYNEEEEQLNIWVTPWYGEDTPYREYIYDFNTRELKENTQPTCELENQLEFSSDMRIFWKECPTKWYYHNAVEAYYYTIPKDIDAAYNLKHKPDISREDFRKLYNDVEDIYVSNYKTLKKDFNAWDETYSADILIKTKWEEWFDVYSVTWYIYFQSIHTTSTVKKSGKIYPINK